MTYRVYHSDSESLGIEKFECLYDAERFAEAMRVIEGIEVSIEIFCEECGKDHDAEDMPPECDECGRCMGDVEPHNGMCPECEDESRECQCPGGEEIGPCHCPACVGR